MGVRSITSVPMTSVEFKVGRASPSEVEGRGEGGRLGCSLDT